MAQNYMRPTQMMRGNGNGGGGGAEYGQQANMYNQGAAAGSSFHIAESSSADYASGGGGGDMGAVNEMGEYDMMGANSSAVNQFGSGSSGSAAADAQWPRKVCLYGIPFIVFFAMIGLFYAVNPVFSRIKKGPDRYQTQSLWWVIPLSALAAIASFILLEVCMKQ